MCANVLDASSADERCMPTRRQLRSMTCTLLPSGVTWPGALAMLSVNTLCALSRRVPGESETSTCVKATGCSLVLLSLLVIAAR